MPITVNCIECGKEQKIIPARSGTYKFCSYSCRSRWRSKNWTGENHPQFNKDAIREKVCPVCNKLFPLKADKNQKFCSMGCTKIGQKRYRGNENSRYRENARRKNRGGPHRIWVSAVINRDLATCQKCGVKDVEMHAHHIKSYKDHPELRFDVDNGITLCFKCHWLVHSVQNENGKNSVKPLTDYAEGNTEPSNERKFVEGVTTRGRTCRRWSGNCEWCGAFISKRWSDTKDKKHLFCSKTCSGKFAAKHRTYRTWKNPESSMVVNSSMSIPTER